MLYIHSSCWRNPFFLRHLRECVLSFGCPDSSMLNTYKTMVTLKNYNRTRNDITCGFCFDDRSVCRSAKFVFAPLWHFDIDIDNQEFIWCLIELNLPHELLLKFHGGKRSAPHHVSTAIYIGLVTMLHNFQHIACHLCWLDECFVTANTKGFPHVLKRLRIDNIYWQNVVQQFQVSGDILCFEWHRFTFHSKH